MDITSHGTSRFQEIRGKVNDEVDSATETDYLDHVIDNGLANGGENNAPYPVRNHNHDHLLFVKIIFRRV